MKNEVPIYFPKKYPRQELLPGENIRAKEDIRGDSYYHWDLYSIISR